MGLPAEKIKNILAPFQYDFCDITTPKTVSIIGSKGPGKTFVGSRFLANCVNGLPKSKGIFACSTIKQTGDIWEQDIKPLFDELQWDYNWNQTKGNIHFWNGTVLHLRSAESPKVIESLQYHFGWQDEVSLADWKFAKTVNSRIRAMHGTGHKRFTSMPDDPEHFIYTWLEGICNAFHEPSLYDNPDKEFVKNYEKELKAIYHGSELDRYLYGKRVSLTGMGLFAADQEHKKDFEYIDEDDLVLCWDFNVGYRAVTSWQEVGKQNNIPQMNCIEAFQMKNYTTTEDAKELCRYYAGHTGMIYLHGDASGENRSAQTSESMWFQIRKVFEEAFPGRVKFVVPRSNPNVKDTIQVTNWALKHNLMSFSSKASTAFRYLVAAKADKYGEIDKKNDNKEGGAKSHEVDTIRYLAWHAWERYFPGTQPKKVESIHLKGF